MIIINESVLLVTAFQSNKNKQSALRSVMKNGTVG